MQPNEITQFRRALLRWYRQHARVLPWRQAKDPYRIWVSEIMLQQTRVNAVLEYYQRFVARFPSLVSLALAPEEEVLAAWSGLGYYRRARMLHKAAQFIMSELDGTLPSKAVELRQLPGIGDYTSAAIASIAFGESIAVVDGNVERVILRLTGRPESGTAEGKRFVSAQAAALVPPRKGIAGDHNQAMMELGATICLPKGPLCLQCPVYHFCNTRGEHPTPVRERMRSRRVAYVLHTRREQSSMEIMLHRRPGDVSLMAGMLELPEIATEAIGSEQPMLRLRHSITNTNYYVEIFAADRQLLKALPSPSGDYQWMRTSALQEQPLTGLARKVLYRLHVLPRQLLRGPETKPVRVRQ